MATIHANSARSAIQKLQLLPLLAGENITHSFINPTIAQSIDLIIQCNLGIDGKRRITEVAVLSGRIEENQMEIETLFKWSGKKYVTGIGNPIAILENKRSHQR
jgi:pilus assembly protein CpaF